MDTKESQFEQGSSKTKRRKEMQEISDEVVGAPCPARHTPLLSLLHKDQRDIVAKAGRLATSQYYPSPRDQGLSEPGGEFQDDPPGQDKDPIGNEEVVKIGGLSRHAVLKQL